jgi:ABC-2 type transport system permease protein
VQSAVLFGLTPQEAEARFEEMLAFAELERFVDQKLKNYSSGMAARLAFAVTIHVDADVLLFDEVLAVGDAAFRHKCIAHFDELRASGKTIVFVTHDTGTISKYCDRALLLHEGRVLGLGPADEIVTEYEELAASQARRAPAAPPPVPTAPPPRRGWLDAGLASAGSVLKGAWRPVRAALRPLDAAVRNLVPTTAGHSSMVGPDLSRFVVLTKMLARTDFRLKYSGTAFNYAWAVAHPAALFGILLLVFGSLGRFDDAVAHYPAYLMLSVVLWTFFSQAAGASLHSLRSRGTLLRKLPLPRLTVPLAAILGATFDLVVNLAVVIVIGLAVGLEPRLSWLELPLLIGVVALFATGVGVLLSSIYVRHRDVGEVWSIASRVLFYATPIFYVVTMLPDEVARVMLLVNPLACVFTEARHAFIDPTAPSAADIIGGPALLLVPFGIVVGLFALGLWAFARESPRAPEYV